MELEYRKCHPLQGVLKNTFIEGVVMNEDIVFLWSRISEHWNESSANSLLHMITTRWFKLRGFSTASAFMEMYKKEAKKSVQKSKSLRKELIQD